MDKFISTDDLLASAKNTLLDFSDHLVSLTKFQRSVITKFTDFVKADPVSMRRNTIKKRSQTKLKDIWEHSHALYVVVCLSCQHPTRLGSPNSMDYLKVLSPWWHGVHHPKGLTAAVEHNQDVLPDLSGQ